MSIIKWRVETIRKIQKYSSGEDDFVQITCELLEKLENEEFELMVIVPEEFGYAKIQCGGNLWSGTKGENTAECTLAIPVPKCMFPLYGVIKINWDAVIDKTRKKMGVCLIVTDHKEKGIGTLCSSKPYILDQGYGIWQRTGNTKYYLGG